MTAEPTPAPRFVPASAKASNGLAVAGFVLALLGVLSSFIPIVNVGGDILAMVGLVLGVFGLMKSGNRSSGKGLSVAAIVLAVAAFIISIMVNVATARMVDSVSTPAALATVGSPFTSQTPADIALIQKSCS